MCVPSTLPDNGRRRGGEPVRGTGARRILSAFVMPSVLTGVSLAPSPATAATVVDCATQDLQQQINAAPSDSTLLVIGTCTGNFTISKNLTLKGNPTATLDGNFAGRVLTIGGSADAVNLKDLTITDG